MITENGESRPHAKGGSRIHCEGTSLLLGPDDLTENIRLAARLVRLLEDQRRELNVAYMRGWRDCAAAFGYAFPSTEAVS